MFGLFKTKPRYNSPEERLKSEMKSKIEAMAFHMYNSSPMKDTPLGGTVLIKGINEAKDIYLARSIAVSEDYGVSRATAIEIIEDCARLVYKENID